MSCSGWRSGGPASSSSTDTAGSSLSRAATTAPVTARVEPMGPGGVLLLSGLFVALWLVSAALFQWSAHHEQPGAAV